VSLWRWRREAPLVEAVPPWSRQLRESKGKGRPGGGGTGRGVLGPVSHPEASFCILSFG